MSKHREVRMASDKSSAARTGGVVSALAAALAVVAGCNSNSAATVSSGNGKQPGANVEAGAAACLRDAPGCACQHEGAVIQCGVALSSDGGATKCATGGQICTNGAWSTCYTNSNDPALKSSSGQKIVTGVSIKSLTAADAAPACANDPCDPYCRHFPDTANGINGGDGGVSTLGCGDASVLSIVTSGSPEASTAPAAVLKDSGVPDGESVIFIDLPPGQTATRSFETPKTSVAEADIYFLIDDTSSMGPAAANLASALTNSTGIIYELKQLITSATPNFGVGRFEDFQQLPYITPEPAQLSSTNPYNIPYQHLLSVQDDQGFLNPNLSHNAGSICQNTWPASCTAAAVQWLTVDAFDSLSPTSQFPARSGGDIPEASVAALWSMATGNGLYYNDTVIMGTNNLSGTLGPLAVSYPSGSPVAGTNNWWQVPRQWWQGSPISSIPGALFTPPSADSAGGPCGAGTVASTYPCFHLNATPVVVLLSDAPAHEGPGGQYPHVNEQFAAGTSPGITGANPWTIQPPATSVWAGGCPTTSGGVTYDGPINTCGTGPAHVCSLTAGTHGLSFGDAIPLPTGSDNLPLAGVYYGSVPSTYRAPGIASPANWFSASSVGGGIISIPAIPSSGQSPFVPGAPVRSSLRDCSAGDDGVECAPGTGGGTVSSTCYNNTTAGVPTRQYSPSPTTYSNSATVTYTPTPVTNPAPLTAPLNDGLQSALALTPTFVATAAGNGPADFTSVASITTQASTQAVSVAPGPQTNNAATYTLSASTQLGGNQSLPAGTCTATLTPAIALTAGQELTNVTVNIIATSQGTATTLSASATIGAATGQLPVPGQTTVGSASSAAGAGYYVGSAGGSASIVVTQSGACGISYTYTVTYQIGSPTACPVGAVDGPVSYTAAGTSATAQCPVCTGTGSTWSGSACTPVACPAGYTQGTGAYASTCYNNTCNGGALNTGTSPPSCPAYCPAVGGIAQANIVLSKTGTAGSNTTVGTCYYCNNNTALTSTANGAVWSCGYTCPPNNTLATTSNTGAGTSNISAGQCGTCQYGGTATYVAPVPSTTAPWTCGTPYKCVTTIPGTGTAGTLGVGGTSGTLVSSCYACPTTPPAGDTVPTLDKTQAGGWQCSMCATANQGILDTSPAAYQCVSCPTAGTTLTAGGANTGGSPKYGTVPTCNSPPTCNAAGGYVVNGTSCKLVSACSTAGAGAGFTVTNDVVAGGPTGGWNVGCGTSGGIPACTPNAASSTQTCYTEVVTGNTCTCQLMTYTAGAAALTYGTTGMNGACDPAAPTPACNNPCTGTATPVASATNCSTAANGMTCAGTSTCSSPGAGYVSCNTTSATTPSCTPSATAAGDGYYGNDLIYKFTVPAGSGFGARYYYHFALLAYGPDKTCTWTTGGGSANRTAAQAGVQPFLYIKPAVGTVVNDSVVSTDKSYPYAIHATQGASDDTSGTGTFGGTVGTANGPVLDCNKSAHTELEGPSPTNDGYVISELDGYLPPGTYYLVVDNAAPTIDSQPPDYQYYLQIGGFDDSPANTTNPPSHTLPSYHDMITALNGIQAKFVGVENSGLSCLQYNSVDSNFWSLTSYAQFETRDFMEKVAYDVGSYDSTTNPPRPYVVSVRKDGTACNPSCPPNATSGFMPGAGNQAAGTCAAWGAAVCGGTTNPAAPFHTTAPFYDPVAQACAQGCTSNSDCPMTTPTCSPGGYCTSGCPGGVSGLSCAVAAAVANLTSNVKQDVYLRPIAITSGSTYVPPGPSCVATGSPSPTSATCTGTTNSSGTATPFCYGGGCTNTCTAGGGQCGTSYVCVPSTITGDPNYGYCVSPSIFVNSVQAISKDAADPTPPPNPTPSDAVCGIHGSSNTACALDSQCPSNLPHCWTRGPGSGYCGINDVGPDKYNPPAYAGENATLAASEMFNLCSPGAQVYFNVTFIMPFQRSPAAQQYEFDLGIYSGASLAGRTRVILENPALQVASFYRDYDGTQVCPTGTHIVWGNFTYNAICPTDGQKPTPNYSQIRFCAQATTPDAGFSQEPPNAVDSPFVLPPGSDNGAGCMPGEVLLGVATANTDPTNTNAGGYVNTCPANGAPGQGSMGNSCQPLDLAGATVASWTHCASIATQAPCTVDPLCQWIPPGGFNVSQVLAANGIALDAGVPADQYLRIRMELDPSTPGDAVAPFLYSWDLTVDCIPSE